MKRSVRAAVESALMFPLVAVFTLVPIAVSGTRFAPFAVATYVGFVVSIAGNAGRVDPPRVGGLDEPRAVNLVRSLVIVLYVDAVVFFGTAIGAGLFAAGHEQAASVVAVLVPSVDATLARFGLPSLGLAGALVILVTRVVAAGVGRIAPDSEYVTAAREITTEVDSLDVLYDALQLRFDRAASAWR